MFNSLSDRITGAFKNIRKKGLLTQADVDKTITDIRRALLDADVALPVVREFTANVREKATGAVRSQALNPSQQIVKIIYAELVEMLGGQARDLNYAQGRPTVIMLAGLQGAGKTTLAGKLGKWLQAQGRKTLLVASDLQRPNAVQQLQVVGERAGVDVWAPEPGNGVGDPVEVARSGVAHADSEGYAAVIVDTAGRLGIDEVLMKQAADIRDAVNPDEVFFVIDAMVGQDAVATANAFQEGVGFTGVVVTKLDGDTRGGAALSVRGVTGQPILFASTGEKLTDFEQFHADRMASRILDMGDVLTLIEQAERTWSEEQQAELATKMSAGEFDLNDFLVQMNQIKRMGSMKKLLGMLPGMGQFRKQLDEWDESSMVRIEAIIQSMTPAERANPKILNGSRRQRIAAGSGTTVQEINSLIERFTQARKVMQQMSSGMPGMPGMPGAGGGSRRQKRAQKRRSGNKKGRSGNPAKRARQEAEAAAAAQRREQARAANPSGSAFGGAGAGSAFGAGAQDANLAAGLGGLGLPGNAGQTGGEQPDIDLDELKRFLR
ncbi:signal recognition particle protein [Actinobaculum suis]|uniref:signal recognition particle protein n=1 Tax=Actinobaculum suis TaxID=1657 RepID=UPI0008087AA1|nr:signal recognition particle protein [Actinobaculum suis]OCA95661.1 signal recognition particle protein [Actinobaculum suis]OCA95862.1 signal recognition particle protein [Actinobaculum suis]